MELEAVEDSGTDTSKPLTIQKRVALMLKWLDVRNRSILDAGCGGGAYVEYLCAMGAKAEGIEYDPKKVDQWLRTHPGDTRIRQGDLSHLCCSTAKYDAVLLNEVLEHVSDETATLRHIYDTIKPGGFLFLFSPNRFHPFETHGFISSKTNCGTGVVKTFLLPYLPASRLPASLRPWARNYWPRELEILVKAQGFNIIAHSFVWQTLEDNSGHQPRYVMRLAPLLRGIFAIAERIPGIRNLGVSQLVVAQKAA